MAQVFSLRPLRGSTPAKETRISRPWPGSHPGSANSSGAVPARASGSYPRRDMNGQSIPDVIFNGPEGRLEGRYHHSKRPNAPSALMLHPHPQYGGTMNNKVVYTLFHAFVRQGFSVLRFNFRGVGRSQGVFDRGEGELSDAASALDWLQTYNDNAASCWIAGFSFGAWIGMQLRMRRPEIHGFVSAAPPANLHDFSFLAPCPSSGLIVQGDKGGKQHEMRSEE